MAAIASDKGAIGAIKVAQDKAKAAAAPKVTVGPQNVGLPGYRPGDTGVGYGPSTGYVAPVTTPVEPVATPVVTPVAVPKPVVIPTAADVAKDPDEVLNQLYLSQGHDNTLLALQRAHLRNTQSYQDSYNAHGGLFSGAQQQARENTKDEYLTAVGNEDLAFKKGGHDISMNTFDKLLKMAGIVSGNGA